ncbi:MAG TPA: ABC transporter ATP-binding protein [Bacillota bacterium]|nr:ABC transporter ATP-binding protein [Bacillota bacterium]
MQVADEARRVASYLLSRPWLTALAVVLTIVGAVEAVAWAQISRVIVDSLLTGQYALFGRYLRYMFLMACVWATVSLASRATTWLLRTAIARQLELEILDALSAPRDWSHSHWQPSEVVSRISNDTRQFSDLLTSVSTSLLSGVLFIVFGLIYGVILHPALALTSLVIGILLPLFTESQSREVADLVNKEHSIWSKTYSKVLEIVRNLEILKALDLGDRLTRRTGLYFEELAQNSIQQTNKRVRAGTVVQAGSALSTAAVVLVGCALMAFGKLSPGTIVAAVEVLPRISGPLFGLPSLLMSANETLTLARRLFEMIDGLNSEAESDSLPKLTGLRHIVVNHLSYCYPGSDREVLHDVSLDLGLGQKIGIVGATGSGKSTLLKLLAGVLTAPSGGVLYDGLPSPVTRTSLWTEVVYVDQRPRLFSGSVLQNILLASDQVDEIRLSEAIHDSGLDQVLCRWPDGLDTQVSGSHATISLGEQQRICVARALYLCPRFLFLDEAMSAMDTATELKVQRELRRLSNEGMCVVVVSHRLVGLIDCDRIAVMKNGHLECLGSHTELLGRSPTYLRLWALETSSACLGGEYSYSAEEEYE